MNDEGTQGHATLRSLMNWEDIKTNPQTQPILSHRQKLPVFRTKQPSNAASKHQMITESPYVFERTYTKGDFKDAVVIGLELAKGAKTISVGKIFKDGVKLKDAYSNTTSEVKNGLVNLDTPFTIVLLEQQLP